jgi:hypothetical protein
MRLSFDRVRNCLPATAALAIALGGSVAHAQGLPSCFFFLPCKLNAGLPPLAFVNSPVRLAPNSERAVFVHVAVSGGVQELYSARLAGGATVKISVPIIDRIHDVEISPDSTRVVYSASEPGSNVRRLFSVPIAGPASANIRLSDDAPSKALISPDSRKVVFRPPAGERLRVVPIEGPAAAGERLTDPFVSGGKLTNFRITADSRSVIYQGDQETVGVVELYRVPLTLTPEPDPPTVKLNAALPVGGDVVSFQVSSSNGPVVYLADQITNNVNELFSVRAGGGGRVRLNQPLPSGMRLPDTGCLGTACFGWTIVPGGARVVFEIEGTSGGQFERQLHSVAIAGGTPVRLDTDDFPLNKVIGYLVNPNGSRIGYSMGDGVTLDRAVFSVPVIGPASASVQVTETAEDGDLFDFTADSSRVLWLRDNVSPTPFMSTPIGGPLSQAVEISGDEDPNWLPVSSASRGRVLYRAQAAGKSILDVFSVPQAGNGNRFNLTQGLNDRGLFIGQLFMSNDGRYVVYAAEQADGRFNLWASGVLQ